MNAQRAGEARTALGDTPQGLEFITATEYDVISALRASRRVEGIWYGYRRLEALWFLREMTEAVEGNELEEKWWRIRDLDQLPPLDAAALVRA